MFRSRAQQLNFCFSKQGDKVAEISGRLSLFAARGSLQIQVESMRAGGCGVRFMSSICGF